MIIATEDRGTGSFFYKTDSLGIQRGDHVSRLLSPGLESRPIIDLQLFYYHDLILKTTENDWCQADLIISFALLNPRKTLTG